MYVTFRIFFLVLFTVNLYALEIDSDTSKLQLLSKSEIFLDNNNSLSFKQIKTKEFKKNSLDVINLGISPQSALWAKFTLKNTTNKPIEKILEYANSEAEDIFFFDGDKKIVDGMFHHRASRNSFNPTFVITLKPHEQRTFYIKSHCKISTFIMKLTLWNSEDFIKYNYEQKFIVLIFFTIILTLLLYNLALLVFTRDIVYLYYLFYLIGVVFFESIYLGVAQLYLLSNELSTIITKATMGYITLLVLPMILFTMEFLHTYRFPRLHKFFKLYLYLIPLIALLSYDNFLFDLNIMLIFFPLAFLMVLSGIYAYVHGTKEASVYLIGWSFVIISLVLSIVHSLGGYNIFEHFRYVNEVAFSLEAFTFSIALAYRIRRLHLQKEDLQHKLIELQKDEHKRLELLVEQQTQDLKISLEEKELLYKELQHRVKNNLAMVISLLQLQIHQTFHKGTKEQLINTCNRINSLAQLYELLHFQNASEKLSTQSYFENIVKNIQIHFELEVKVVYDIKHNIHLHDLIYCGLIINELVTNSFKYAFTHKGTIEIKTYQQGDETYLDVSDDGFGYKEKKKNSLGLIIVKTLSKKQLHGKIDITTQNGTKTLIHWREEKKR